MLIRLWYKKFDIGKKSDLEVFRFKTHSRSYGPWETIWWDILKWCCVWPTI